MRRHSVIDTDFNPQLDSVVSLVGLYFNVVALLQIVHPEGRSREKGNTRCEVAGEPRLNTLVETA